MVVRVRMVAGWQIEGRDVCLGAAVRIVAVGVGIVTSA
jgi:hypothetical protein